MGGVQRSRRGVYYDLSVSPYEFKTPYGDILKFSSKKKLEIYTRDVPDQLERLNKAIERNNLTGFIPPRVKRDLEAAVYRAFYSQVEK